MKSGYQQHFKKMAANKDANALADQLRQRIKSKNTKKKSYRVPWKLVVASTMGIVIAGAGALYIDNVENFLKRVEISVLGTGAVASTVAQATPQQASTATAAEVSAAVQIKTDFTAEEINHLSRLNERKKELDAREEELNRVEQELNAQKKSLEARLKELENARKNISSVLQDRVNLDDSRIETLVQMYSGMKPQQAAKVIESLDEDLAVEILGRMKRKVAAEVMNLMNAEKAQVLSEKYAGYKTRTPASQGTEKSESNN